MSALQKFPDAGLVQRETEPRLTQDHIDRGEHGLNDYDAEHKAWGRRGWDRVDALCAWFNELGGEFTCPAPKPD